MKRLWLIALLALGLPFAGRHAFAPVAAAQPSPVPSPFCIPPNTISNGQAIIAPPLQANFQFGGGCTLNPGYIFTDGPVYGSATFSFSGGSFNFTIPAMSWVTQGIYAYSASTAEVAPTSTTTYYFIECHGCSGIANATWETNTTSTPPDVWAELMYTVTTNGSGITGVTFPTAASLIINTMAQWGSNINSGFISYGTLGSATANVLRIGNNGTSGYTAIGSGAAGTINGITDTVLGIGDTGTPQAVLDHSGNWSIAGSYYGNGTHLSGVATLPVPITQVSPSPVPTAPTGNNIVLAQVTPSPIPQPGTIYNTGPHIGALAASSPLPSPCQTPGNGGIACFNDTNAGGGATMYLGTAANSDVIDYNHTHSNTETHSQVESVPGLTDTGLSSSSLALLCAPNNAAISQCSGNPSLLYATTGTGGSATTGAVANTYQGLACNTGALNCSSGVLSFTTGTNPLGLGQWIVHIEMWMSVANNTPSGTEYLYGCVASTSTFTKGNVTTDGSSTCITALTNSFMGGPGFGINSGATAGMSALSQFISADVIVANGTSISITPKIAGSTTTSATVPYYVNMKGEWN